MRFESDSVSLVRFDEATSTMHLALRRERNEGAHWFEFRASLPAPPPGLAVVVDNAHTSLYSNGWSGYLPFVEEAPGAWRRVAESTYVDGVFSFVIENPGPEVHAAWYEPYSLERSQAFINGHLGQAASDDFTVLRLGDQSLPRITILARQHPGETIASFFFEGLIAALTPHLDRVLQEYSVVIVPIMNVEGVRHQTHRYDLKGRDYNRLWGVRNPPAEIATLQATMSSAPSHVLFLDIHGDEVSKVNYASYRLRRETRLSQEILAGIPTAAEPPTYVWRPTPYWKRLAKSVLRRRRVILPRGTTASDYATRAGADLSLTYELSASRLTPEQARAEGARLAGNLYRALVRLGGTDEEANGAAARRAAGDDRGQR